MDKNGNRVKRCKLIKILEKKSKITIVELENYGSVPLPNSAFRIKENNIIEIDEWVINRNYVLSDNLVVRALGFFKKGIACLESLLEREKILDRFYDTPSMLEDLINDENVKLKKKVEKKYF